MKKKSLLTNQMKFEYSTKIVLSLYLQKLLNLDEYQEVLAKLRETYHVEKTSQESNGRLVD
jgi:hypothetical protein